VVQPYLNLLKRFNIPVDDIEVRFQSPDYALYDLLTNNECREKSITKLTSSYSKEDYDKFFHQILKILKTIECRLEWEINQIPFILKELASRNSNLFYEVVRHYLEQGDYLEINHWVVVPNLLSTLGTARAFSVLNTPEYPSKNKWLFSYYQHLPIDDIQLKDISALYDLYEESKYKYFIGDIDYLLKYESIQKGFVTDIVQIIIRRARVFPEFAHSLFSMFQPSTEINKTLNLVSLGKFNLLEEAYIALDRVKQHFIDYNGKTLSIILDNDPTFIDKYLEDKFTREVCLMHCDDNRDYSFIWLRNDYMDIMQRVTSIVFENVRDNHRYCDYYESFYNKSVNPQTDDSILNKQNNYLLKEIECKSDKNDYMQFLFSLITSFPLQRKLIFYTAFLEKNKKLDDFKNLPFESTSIDFSSSVVPMSQEKIDFYEKVTELCNSVTLLEHRKFIESKIRGMKVLIQYQEKKDFTEE
jgi:hypothetical protein